MSVCLKQVQPEQLDLALNFIEEARAFLKEQGIDQWQSGYPDVARIKEDIFLGQGYFVVNDAQEPAGYLYIDFGRDSNYDRIFDGDWINDDEDSYMAFHRVAMGSTQRGNGLASKAFDLGREMGKARGKKSFRIDTHEDNVIMQHVLKKNGFLYCGTVYVLEGKRRAYEKFID